jgi:putative nucleotidyltransferase with HDIG domain
MATQAEASGFLERLSTLLRRLTGGGATVETQAHRAVGTTDTEESPQEFIVAPGGYRIRVPRLTDMPDSVGEALPEVRQGLELLPPLPAVVTELLREIQSSHSTAASVAQIAASDPSLAASLLRAVNGAAFGLSRKVTSVAEAVSYLGFGVVRSLVVQLRLEQVMPLRSPAAALAAEDLWIHSLAVSYMADALAQRVSDVDRGFVATLGLLHDIGRLAIIAQFPDRSIPAAGETRLDRERAAFGADHAVIGAMLALRWKLPADLTQAIRWHHAPDKAFEPNDPIGVRKAIHLVHVADQLAKYCFAYSTDMEIDPILPGSAEILGLPTSVTRLLDAKVREAAAKAILLADETSKRPLATIRPFLKLTRGVDAVQLASRLKDVPAGPPRIEIDARAADLFEQSKAVSRFDAPAARPGQPGSTLRLIAPASSAGIDWLVKNITAQWVEQGINSRLYSPVRTTLRALLANLIPTKAEAAAEIEVAHQFDGGRLQMAVRSPRLLFASRLPADAIADTSRRILEAELANVLNLGWFSFCATPGGEALHLQTTTAGK